MQIVEYLYATLFGNDLRAGSNLSVLSPLYSSNIECYMPDHRTAKHLSTAYSHIFYR